jgi:hypothetical protein
MWLSPLPSIPGVLSFQGADRLGPAAPSDSAEPLDSEGGSTRRACSVSGLGGSDSPGQILVNHQVDIQPMSKVMITPSWMELPEVRDRPLFSVLLTEISLELAICDPRTALNYYEHEEHNYDE